MRLQFLLTAWCIPGMCSPQSILHLMMTTAAYALCIQASFDSLACPLSWHVGTPGCKLRAVSFKTLRRLNPRAKFICKADHATLSYPGHHVYRQLSVLSCCSLSCMLTSTAAICTQRAHWHLQYQGRLSDLP
jgi:hypothetical protein